MLDVLDDQVNRLAGYKILSGFGTGLISFFIPIFIAQQGFDPSVIFSFLLVDVMTFAIVSIPVGYAVSRIGVSKSLVLSSIIYVVVFIVLQSFELNYLVIYSVAAMIGVSKAFTWIPMNSEYTEGSDKEDRGEKYGRIEGIPQLITPFAPLVGGAILSYFSFGLLVSISFVLVLASILPLIYRRVNDKPEYGSGNIFELEKYDLWALFFLDGIASNVYAYVFPLFIFYIIGDTLNVGAASTLLAIGAGIFSIGAGKATDIYDRRKLMIIGGILSGAIYIIVPGLVSRNWALAASFVMGLTYMIYTAPLSAVLADIAEKENILGFYSSREVIQGLGKIAVLGGTVIAFTEHGLETAFKFAFYSAGASVVILTFLAKKIDVKN